MNSLGTGSLAVTAVILGIIVVGCIDYITGIEVRVFPLYFLPLVMAATIFGKRGAVAASILASLVWVASHALGGRVYSHSYIWAINFLSQGTVFLIVSILIAKLRDAHTHEHALSRTDSLTGLMNSRAFHEQAGAALALCHRHKRSATLAFMDLDNFKNVNDTAGHQTGDKLLQMVAQTISPVLRASDFVARVGGDEFVLFLPETDDFQAKVALEKIREQLMHTEAFRAYAISVSIGAVVYSQAPPRIGEMLTEADALMYSVKAAGKNAVHIRHTSTTPGSA
jgi:diguanylate cyclase (GGDEF)-like protein